MLVLVKFSVLNFNDISITVLLVQAQPVSHCMHVCTSLIRPPYLARNCGHIREVDLCEKEVTAFIAVGAKIFGHIGEGALC